VRVNEGLYAAVREKIDDIARAQGFGGRLVVLGEPGIAVGDCRIEWADGGVNRDTGVAERAIGEAVARYISARRNFAGAS
jgi:flagellar assembly protein FliH